MCIRDRSFQVSRSLVVCGRAVESLPWVKKCPSGVRQYYMPLHWAQKVSIHELIQCKWPECWLKFMRELFFQVLKNLEVSGRVSSTDGKVPRWSKSVLLATATNSESVNSWFNPVQMARTIDLPSWQNSLSRCRGVLWSVVVRVKRCPDGVRQYYMPLHWAQKVSIHDLIQYKWPEC